MTIAAMPSRLPLLPDETYDPWVDLAENWPHVRVVIEPMAGDLLGEVRDAGLLIALREGTSEAQRRCTLAHELVHLERGIFDCGQWEHREELHVHSEVARRLISLSALIEAIRALGGSHDLPALGQHLDVDGDTLGLRFRLLSRAERVAIRRALVRQVPLWAVA
jgi:hypothetical protein